MNFNNSITKNQKKLNMRSGSKLRHIDRVNYLAEQRYLESKGLVTETSHSAPPNVAQEKDRPRVAPHSAPPNVGQEKDRPRMAPHKAGPPDIAQEKDRPRVAPYKAGPPEIGQEKDRVNEVGMDIVAAAGEWITGGGLVSVGGESVPANLAKVIMGVMPTAAATGFIAQFWDEIKSKVGGNQEPVQEVKLIDNIPADSNYKGTFDIQNDDHVHKWNQQLISYISRAGKVSEAEAAKKAGEWLMKLANGV